MAGFVFGVANGTDGHRVIAPLGTAKQDRMSDIFGFHPVIPGGDPICQIVESPIPPRR